MLKKKKCSGDRTMWIVIALVLCLRFATIPVSAAPADAYDCWENRHLYEVELLTPAGKETDGLRRYTCQLCGRSYEEVIPKYGHTFGDWVVEIPASCTQEGRRVRVCIHCGQPGAREEAPISMTGHVYGDWEIKTAATMSAEGIKVRTCIYDCGTYESQSIPELAADKIKESTEAGVDPVEVSVGWTALDGVLIGSGGLACLVYGVLIYGDIWVLVWYWQVKREAMQRWRKGVFLYGE